MKLIISALLLISLSVMSQSLAMQVSTVDANIVNSEFQSGDWDRGTAMGGNCAKITNTGDTPHTFWIQLSAEDPNGKSWWADARSVYLLPGETSDWVCSIWIIPDNVPLGSYSATLHLAEEYNSDSGIIYNQEDSIDQPNAFNIVR